MTFDKIQGFIPFISGLIVLGAMSLSCERKEPVEPEPVPPTVTDLSSRHKVSMSVEPVLFEDQTKVSMSSDDSGLSFSWSEDDAVGVYSAEGGFARYSLTSGTGTDRAVFDGQGFALTKGGSYYAFYPYDMYASDRAAVVLNYGGQQLTGDGDISSLLSHDYLYSSAVAEEEGEAGFLFHHAGAFLRLKMTLPQGMAIDSIELLPSYGDMPTSMSLDLETGICTASNESVSLTVDASGCTVPESGVFTAWLSMPSRSFIGSDFAVIVRSGENVYTLRQKGYAFSQGRAYRWDGAPLVLGESSPWGMDAVAEVSSYSPGTSSVPSGEYSGITWLGGSRYAVVHDKLNGGGIVFYDIKMSDTGTVSAVSMTTPEGTSSSAESGRDNEGIAFLPDGDGSLFVSSEAEQSIREYDLQGYPTGRSISIPSDLSTGSITSNKGFESLTYNAVTGLFWTTTESELKKDTSVERLLRLQSFDKDLNPSGRYFYQMDAPTKTASEAAAAKSYVFGVPALAAMDDGRLLVLEREVYVPNGNYIQMAMNSFTKMNLYVVNPSEDTAGILRKSLVKSFSTSALTLANYEGMCLGPTLSDGSRALVLIPDSQGGMSGLTKEYVKVISIK